MIVVEESNGEASFSSIRMIVVELSKLPDAPPSNVSMPSSAMLKNSVSMDVLVGGVTNLHFSLW